MALTKRQIDLLVAGLVATSAILAIYVNLKGPAIAGIVGNDAGLQNPGGVGSYPTPPPPIAGNVSVGGSPTYLTYNFGPPAVLDGVSFVPNNATQAWQPKAVVAPAGGCCDDGCDASMSYGALLNTFSPAALQSLASNALSPNLPVIGSNTFFVNAAGVTDNGAE